MRVPAPVVPAPRHAHQSGPPERKILAERTMEATSMLGADEVCHLISNWAGWNSQPRPMVRAPSPTRVTLP